MEPKKQSNYREGRPTLQVPQRGDHSAGGEPVTHRPRRQTSGSKWKPLGWRLPRFTISKKAVRIASIVGASLLVAALLYSVIASQAAKSPDFEAVLPDNKPIAELGGWQRVSPPKNDPVFAYRDAIGDIGVTVSQQPLPKSFADNISGNVAEVAKKFNATNKIEDDNLVIYVGTSVKGPQSAILTKDGLLILIKSDAKVNDTDWVTYAKALN